MNTTLKRRWKISLVVLGILVVGFGGWFVTRPKEPVYQGKSVSEWFDQIQYVTNLPSRFAANDPAVDAIIAIGKDSTPFLIKQLHKSNSHVRELEYK
jgi:hypothetical protein